MITSLANQQIKEVQKLQKSSDHRSSKRLFIVEGWRMFKEVPPSLIEKIYVINEENEAFKDIKPCQVIKVSEAVMKGMSREVHSQGILAVVKMAPTETTPIHKDKPLIIALDAIQDPGNLGTIIRTAEAAGVDQIVLSKGTVDLYNPKVVKSTMGAIFRMNIRKDVILETYIKDIKELNILVYAAHLNGKKAYYEVDLSQGTCLLMGNEGNGIREGIAKLATDLIKIPMTGEAESLNVAIATGIMAFEAIRQRRS